MGGMKSPRDTGEDIPPFFLPARYKLLFKVYELQKNSARIGRKPIPEKVKKEFAAKAKEYMEYKHAERLLLD